ncbi:MAG: hypothetical protein HC914_20590 [Chloroflexaceae bacterium]|nr:hypothetical protein [Chloroflexaceae bacterium]
MVEVMITLPETLASVAQASGVLTAETMERLIRAELRRRQREQMLRIADEMADQPGEPLSAAEIGIAFRTAQQGNQHITQVTSYDIADDWALLLQAIEDNASETGRPNLACQSSQHLHDTSAREL